MDLIKLTFEPHLANRCLLCRQPSQNELSLCRYCQADLNYFDYNRFNNLLLRPDIFDGLKRPKYDILISLAPYQWPFNQWISDLKFNEQFNLAFIMATQLADLLSHLIAKDKRLRPDAIIPVPIHPLRYLTRGYNQSYLLAEVICKALALPLSSNQLFRSKATEAQSSLSPKLRQSNVKNAFRYQGEVYDHIAIIDDVITTGATVNSICKVLKQHKVKRISVWTICATPKTSQKTNENKEK